MMGKISNNIGITLRRWLERHPDLFVDAIKDDGYIDGFAYDILLSRGHCTDDCGLHQIIECTVKDTLAKLRDIQPCHCHNCETGEGW